MANLKDMVASELVIKFIPATCIHENEPLDICLKALTVCTEKGKRPINVFSCLHWTNFHYYTLIHVWITKLKFIFNFSFALKVFF